MTTVQIKHRFTDEVIFTCEVPEQHSGMALRSALEQAALSRANLSRANLYGANLSRANLYGANLSRANLYGANLSRANLDGANLSRANLDGANLYGANLDGANLYGANLDGETLSQTPVIMTGLCWPILITDGFMRIGCQRHLHEEWEGFESEEIEDMDGYAPTFWAQWREPLLAMCKAHASSQKKEQ